MKNLKKVLFAGFFMVLALGVSAQSQLKFGVKAGFNASTVTGYGDFFKGSGELADVTGGEFSNSYKPGFHVGVTTQYLFNPTMGIETGLFYTTLGSQSKYEISQGGASGEVKGTVSASYLQLPIAYLYKFDLGNGLSIYPSAGVYFGYGIGDGKTKLESSVSGAGAEDFSNTEETKLFAKEDGEDKAIANRFDMGLTFGATLEISNMTIGLGYDMGLMKLNKEDLTDGSKKYDDFKNGNIKVSIGYFF